MRADDGGVLAVDPLGVGSVAAGLRVRSTAVAGQRRICDGIEVAVAHPTVGAELELFASMWGSAVTALGRELDLLGVELGRSAQAVVAVDRAGVR